MQQLGWVDGLAAVLLLGNKTGGAEIGIGRRESLQSATMVCVCVCVCFCPKQISEARFSIMNPFVSKG